MIDVFTEKLRSFADASKVLPGRPHCATIARWATKGRHGVKLETVVIGGRRYTSLEAIQRFIAQLNDYVPAEAAGQSATRCHDELVERQLDAEGL
jgi:Protein of unknown function (DUF1580)